jgi:molybdate transport system substrate-binding protein
MTEKRKPIGGTVHLIAAAVITLLISPLATASALAADVRVAVAANFTRAAKEIGDLFERATEHKAVFSFGSTGQLYAQITQGAPFEVFLAADQKRPKKAVVEDLAVADTRFTYATGTIVLFSKDPTLVRGESTLKEANFNRIAIANPVTAPYGAAAVAAMRALGVYHSLEPRIVRGNNIAQTYQFVETDNAEIGFVALSQVARHAEGSRWVVPDEFYPVIAQDAVLLKRGADNAAARAFIAFLKGSEAAAVKRKYGYGSGD